MKPNHPSEVELALFAGGDLGFFEKRKVRSHVSNCPQCQREVQASLQASIDLTEVASEMPPEVNWSRLSQEISGNIRVGLAAGECIAGFEKSLTSKPKLVWHGALVMGCATAVVLATLWLNLPPTQMNHLMTALRGVRLERIGMPVRDQSLDQAVVLETSGSMLEVKSNGRTLSMFPPRSDGAMVPVNKQDSAGMRYVDTETGQVTLNQVYYAQ